MTKESKRIIPTAEPFYFPGGKTGCLLVHGFTGTPREMRFLGEYLHKQGHTVLGIRLAGHATDIKDLIPVSDLDWLASVEDGYHTLRASCDQIYIAGFSLGGILAFVSASYLAYDGVIALATPYELPCKIAVALGPLLVPLSKIFPVIPQKEGEWFNPEMGEGHIYYAGRPLRPVYEMLKLIERMRCVISEIDIPVLTVNSRDDLSVLPDNAERLFQHIGAEDKTQVWVEGSNHALILDGDLMRVFGPIGEIVERVNRR